MPRSRGGLLLQNETNKTPCAAGLAQERGHRVDLVFSPLVPALAANLLTYAELLAASENEYAELCDTLGGEGAVCCSAKHTESTQAPAVTAKDSVGEDDTAFGTFLARLDHDDSTTAGAFALRQDRRRLHVMPDGGETVIAAEAEIRAFFAAEKYPQPSDNRS